MEALGDLNPPPKEAVQIALENLRNDKLRIQALDVLSRMGPFAKGATKELERNLSNSKLRPETRHHLIDTIGSISQGEPETLKALVLRGPAV
jgi:hypothetical protein